jgi:transcriptional regulator with XRE-family HTH domain
MQENLETIKLIVALRCARAAVGMSQEEMANLLGVPKTTIARVETMEGSLRADQFTKIMRLFNDLGFSLDFMYSDEVTLRITVKGLETAGARLSDENRRRSDRKQRSVELRGNAVERRIDEDVE